MRRHIEGKDLLYEAIILKILVKVALMAIKDNRLILYIITNNSLNRLLKTYKKS